MENCRYELSCTSESEIEEYVTTLKNNGYEIKKEGKEYIIYIPGLAALQEISVLLHKELILGVLEGVAYIEIYDDYRE